MANFRPTDRLTSFLLPPSIDEWLPERHRLPPLNTALIGVV